MRAAKRTAQQLQKHSGIKWELDRLEKAANKQIRETLPQFRYNGEVAKALLDDLAAVVRHDDWRSPLERSADQLRQASKHIREAVRLSVRAAKGSPEGAVIPRLSWEATADAKAEYGRTAALPAGDQLFGRGGAVESLLERQRRMVVDLMTVDPHFLKAMLVYAARLQNEATRLGRIIKVRDRRYDRLGPIVDLIRDVRNFTGSPNDAVVARLLTDAFAATGGSGTAFSPDSIRKIRERHARQ